MDNVEGVVSISSDPRNFKLAPYSLNASTQYYVSVDVSRGKGSVAIASNYVAVMVGRSGVVASLSQGSSLTVRSIDALRLTADGSYDINFGRSDSAAAAAAAAAALTYLWTCVQHAPFFGEACPGGFALSIRNDTALSVIGD